MIYVITQQPGNSSAFRGGSWIFQTDDEKKASQMLMIQNTVIYYAIMERILNSVYYLIKKAEIKPSKSFFRKRKNDESPTYKSISQIEQTDQKVFEEDLRQIYQILIDKDFRNMPVDQALPQIIEQIFYLDLTVALQTKNQKEFVINALVTTHNAHRANRVLEFIGGSEQLIDYVNRKCPSDKSPTCMFGVFITRIDGQKLSLATVPIKI